MNVWELGYKYPPMTTKNNKFNKPTMKDEIEKILKRVFWEGVEWGDGGNKNAPNENKSSKKAMAEILSLSVTKEPSDESQSEPSKAIEFAEWLRKYHSIKWVKELSFQELYDIFTNPLTRQEK